ncbi:hypothetical protein RHMOL_Rhmol04G0359600 [Rhododendron molle]|uniref:Uncharacterized protein n=1 Tax=Rhododendron molle TaxID=49168 RepID=A0ACC0P802_RHOML|nr:hypothetical protein RHMOL_Rhmol04G0359600 [Rhododendron molle]
MVMERVQEEEEEDTAEPSTTQCTHHHPHKPTTDSGICPFCLQEKLTKLVSSSTSPFPISQSCPSPPSPNAESSRSDSVPPKPTLSTSSLNSLNVIHHINTTANSYNHEYNSTRAFLRIPFVQTQKKKKKDKNKDQEKDSAIFFNRSKSTTTPRCGGGRDFDEYTPRKRGFFRSLVSLSRNPSARKIESRDWREEIDENTPRKREDFAEVLVEEKEGSPETEAFDRKVSRSRSVGCGGGSSRSFSGDFFDRISTGFGDCALRRAESYRESKQKITAGHRRRGSAAVDGGGRGYVNERVKCGGIFSGFMPNSSSSSSSSSSCLVSSSVENGGAAAAVVRHGRSKSWGWAFASPLRALNKHPSNGKREGSNKKKNTSPMTPNIHAIPSILVFRARG